MGAKIGKGTIISTTRIFDCDLIEIGANCVIGGNVAIAAHTGEARHGILRKVKIGDQVTIGADAYIMPGVVLEDNVIVGANSLIPKDAYLSANSIYGVCLLSRSTEEIRFRTLKAFNKQGSK